MNLATTSPQVSRKRNSCIQDKRGAKPNVSCGGPTESSSSEAFGERYENCHHAVHSSPIPPANTKIQRQVEYKRIVAMRGGATTAPTAVPELTMPIAVARSFVGNHSATARVAAGKPPPSPMPSRNRLVASI